MPIDPSAIIAPTARVHPESIIGPGVRIGEFCIIESDVAIGPGCVLEPYVYVKRWTTLGERNEISAGTVLGTDPLDKGFGGTRSYLRIGNDNKIREHFTISRGTAPETTTEIGDGNYIMTSGHIAHNCRIGNRTVIASCALLAGYVEATRMDDAEKNRLCPPNRLPNVPLDWLRGTLIATNADYVWSKEADIANWLDRSRLNPSCGLRAKRDEPAVRAAMSRFAASARPGLTQLAKFLAAAAN